MGNGKFRQTKAQTWFKCSSLKFRKPNFLKSSKLNYFQRQTLVNLLKRLKSLMESKAKRQTRTRSFTFRLLSKQDCKRKKTAFTQIKSHSSKNLASHQDLSNHLKLSKLRWSNCSRQPDKKKSRKILKGFLFWMIKRIIASLILNRNYV